MELNNSIIEYIENHSEEALELLKSIAVIPAPSCEENLRAEFVYQWLKQKGAEDCTVDSDLNVLLRFGDFEGEGAITVFAAHSDIVFSDCAKLPLRTENNRIWCPGAGDDTANLAALLMAAAYVLENRLQPVSGCVLIAADSGEEGLGNLKGTRRIMSEYGNRIGTFFSFDSWNGAIINRAVGSKRYRITVETEGGHSYNDFGNENAIVHISRLTDKLYQMHIPEKGTTFNVGTVSGGTSVNTIAERAEMLFEIRSDCEENFSFMEKQFTEIINGYNIAGVKINCELIGERPCMGDVDPKEMQNLMDRCRNYYIDYYGKEPVFKAGSTDCNIPLSMGIPSLCIGCFDGGGAHTREEYVEIDSLKNGLKVAFAALLHYFREGTV